MMEKKDLIDLARMPMPFGKYKGRVLIDLPENYLLWLRREGLPQGRLGTLLALALEIKIEGLQGLVKPLKSEARRTSDV